MSRGPLTKYWLLTFFNEQIIDNHQSHFKTIFEENAKIQYIIYQIERAPDTGRVHVQGYFCFGSRIRLPGIKKLVKDQTVHAEPRRGTNTQAIDYCSKDESRVEGPFEYGERPEESRKRKLDEVKQWVDDGKSELEIAEEFFGQWVRYYRAIREYRLLRQPGRDFKTEVRVYFGPSGVGKSRRATYETTDAYRKPLGEWWDGYDGCSDVIIDDFYGWLRFDELLRCLDRYPHRVPIKGGFVNFAPRLLIITSNVEPRGWYDEERITDYRFDALRRRLDVVEHMTDDWSEPGGRMVDHGGEMVDHQGE